MRTIWKFPITIVDEQIITIPEGSTIIHTGLDPQGNPCIWAEVDSIAKLKRMIVYIVGTGNPLPEVDYLIEPVHVGSFVQGPFVWHIYA